MHELFLGNIIPKANVDLAMRILQGYCGHSPVHFIRREQFWEGPRSTNAMKPLVQALVEKKPRDKVAMWKELDKNISKQSFCVKVSYEIDKSEFGEAEGKSEVDLMPLNFDKRLGTLRWNDVPDTLSARPTTNGRSFIEIADDTELPNILQSMNYRFARELIKDGYRFVHNNVLIELFRNIPLHPEGEISNLGNPLPAIDSLELFDPEDKWLLMATVKVNLGTSTDRKDDSQKLNQLATEQLIKLKTDFEDSVITLTMLDRLWFDTRVKS